MLSTDCSAKVPTSWTINAGFPCCQRINSAFLFEYLQILSRQWWLYLNKSVYCVGCLDSAHRVNLNCVFTSLCVYSQCRWRTGESALWMICLSPSKPSLSRMVLVSDIPLWYLGRSTEMVRHTQTHRHTHTHIHTYKHAHTHPQNCSSLSYMWVLVLTYFIQGTLQHCAPNDVDTHSYICITISLYLWWPNSTTGEPMRPGSLKLRTFLLP